MDEDTWIWEPDMFDRIGIKILLGVIIFFVALDIFLELLVR